LSDTEKYVAFISYSSSDKKIAKWLHRKLEAFKVPKEIRANGSHRSKRLRPIFRDRDELSASGDLGEKLRHALDNSGCLIVICTKASSTSDWVKEEISYFKSKHSTKKIIPVIAPDQIVPVFPDPLSKEGPHLVPLGADFRSDADGKKNGILKIASALLEVRFDALKRREDRAQRRRLLFTFGALVFATALSIVSIVSLLQVMQKNSRMERALQALLDHTTTEMRDTQTSSLLGELSVTDARIRVERADAALETAFVLSPEHIGLRHVKAHSLITRAKMESLSGNSETAVELATQALSILQDYDDKLVLARYGNDAHRVREQMIAWTLQQRAFAYSSLGKHRIALKDYEQAEAVAMGLDNLVEVRPDLEASMAKIYEGKATELLFLRKYNQAVQAQEMAVSVYDNLKKRFPAEVGLEAVLLSSRLTLSRYQRLAGYETVDVNSAEIVKIARQFNERAPSSLHTKRDLETALIDFADQLIREGDYQNAEISLLEANKINDELVYRDPSPVNVLVQSRILSLQGLLEERRGNIDEACKKYNDELRSMEEYRQFEPNSQLFRLLSSKRKHIEQIGCD